MKAINQIKILPGRVYFNSSIRKADFDVSEVWWYPVKYFCKITINSMKRYGILGTVKRQIWSRCHNKYIEELKKRVDSNG